MAFLSHSLPWHVIASMFEYADSSNPGPQHPELYAKNGANQQKQLEYFAQQFQATIREHSVIERRRYRPIENHVNRAQEWTASKHKRIITPADLSSVPATDLEMEEMRDEKAAPSLRPLANRTWSSSSLEGRLVFPPNFATTYMPYVPLTSGADYGRSGIVQEFSRIEAWTDLVERNTKRSTLAEDERNRLRLDTRSCSDILRLLVIDAATTANADRRSQMLDTIFLLAHHPKIGLTQFLNVGMACCNIEVGIAALAEKISLAFIYLNLLLTHVTNNAECDLLSPREHVREYKGRYFCNNNFVSLIPRPAYMNTSSYNRLLEVVLREHGHVVEHVFFNPVFAPYSSGRRSRYRDPQIKLDGMDKRIERDVFTDIPRLKATLKEMWKILVYCDMILCDAGQRINWTWLVYDSLAGLFPGKGGVERIFGKSWTEFALEREDQIGCGLLTERHTDRRDM